MSDSAACRCLACYSRFKTREIPPHFRNTQTPRRKCLQGDVMFYSRIVVEYSTPPDGLLRLQTPMTCMCYE